MAGALNSVNKITGSISSGLSALCMVKKNYFQIYFLIFRMTNTWLKEKKQELRNLSIC